LHPDDCLILGPSVAQASAVAILLHGRGRSPEEMRGIAEQLALPSVRFLFPAAPGGSWYPKNFRSPLAENEPGLSRSLAAYGDLAEAVIAAGTPPDKLVLGGFSQGACLTAELLFRRPHRYGAAIIWTGSVIGPPGTEWPVHGALAGVPVYLSSSENDEWITPAEVHAAETVLRRTGADVQLRMLPERDHCVSEAEIADVRALLMGRGLAL